MPNHASDCMCMTCAADRATYCALTRGVEPHQDHLIPTCPSSAYPPADAKEASDG